MLSRVLWIFLAVAVVVFHVLVVIAAGREPDSTFVSGSGEGDGEEKPEHAPMAALSCGPRPGTAWSHGSSVTLTVQLHSELTAR
jgi:hypothetical protein